MELLVLEIKEELVELVQLVPQERIEELVVEQMVLFLKESYR